MQSRCLEEKFQGFFFPNVILPNFFRLRKKMDFRLKFYQRSGHTCNSSVRKIFCMFFFQKKKTKMFSDCDQKKFNSGGNFSATSTKFLYRGKRLKIPLRIFFREKFRINFIRTPTMKGTFDKNFPEILAAQQCKCSLEN